MLSNGGEGAPQCHRLTHCDFMTPAAQWGSKSVLKRLIPVKQKYYIFESARICAKVKSYKSIVSYCAHIWSKYIGGARLLERIYM